MIPPDDALQKLRDGNQRFVDCVSELDAPEKRAHEPELASGQKPFAIILACSDSRVPVELVFDQGFGDLFVIRVAGNIVAPSQIGSIEYAATQFGTQLVVVLGHSNCGAVVATLQELAKKAAHRSPNLRAIVDRVRPAVKNLVKSSADAESPELLASAIEANVRASVSRLQHGSIVIEELIEAGSLKIVGAEYSIETGTVRFID